MSRSFETEIMMHVSVEYDYSPGTRAVHDKNDGWMPGDPSEVTNVKVLVTIPVKDPRPTAAKVTATFDIYEMLEPKVQEEVLACCYEDAGGE